jgi:hypothetical protein
VSFGGFATVNMDATVIVPITASVSGGTLTVGVGTPAVTTTTDVVIDPAVYVVAALTGGLPLVAVTAAVDIFGGGFLNGFVNGAIVAAIRSAGLPSVSLPLAGPFANMTVNQVQTTEPTAPTRTFTVVGVTFPLDRAHDLFIRLL